MTCRHCNSEYSEILPFLRSIEGGRAYAQACEVCHHIIALRPHLDTDPPVVPRGLTDLEAARLLFLRWRLRSECNAQTMVYHCVQSPAQAA
jgi:hypothetical protein